MPQQPDDDLDAWYADHVRPYRPQLLGRIWELPGALPATKVLLYQQFIGQAFDPTRDPASELDIPEEFAEAVTETGDLSWPWIIADLVGQPQLDEWYEAGLTEPHQHRLAATLLDRYVLRNGALVRFVDAMYAAARGEDPEEVEPAGKAPAGTSKPRKRGGGSSPAGRRSKPAGKPSTTRTSATSSSSGSAPGAGSPSA